MKSMFVRSLFSGLVLVHAAPALAVDAAEPTGGLQSRSFDAAFEAELQQVEDFPQISLDGPSRATTFQWNGWEFTSVLDENGTAVPYWMHLTEIDPSEEEALSYYAHFSGSRDESALTGTIRMDILESMAPGIEPVESFVMKLTFENPVYSQGELVDFDVSYTLDAIGGNQYRWNGRILSDQSRITFGTPSYHEAELLGASGGPVTQALVIYCTAPHVCAGVGVVVVAGGTAAGAAESLNGNYRCNTTWRWWWNGCWWADL